MGRPSDYLRQYSQECPPDRIAENCVHIVCHMRGGKSKETFAGKIGKAVSTIYLWAEEHEEFSEAVKKGEALSLLWWENLMQSGTAGQLRAVTSEEYGKDGKVLKRKFRSAHFHPVGAIFTLKNRFPKLYKDRIDLRHSGDPEKADGLEDLTMEELQAKADHLASEIRRAGKK